MKLTKLLFSLLSLFAIFSSPIISTPAQAIEPFPPFSVEGNPPEEYYFDQIFPLFTFVRPSYFQVFENEDYSRNYQGYEICPGKNSDHRDDYCNSEDDDCEGGDVDICFKGLKKGQFSHTAHSGQGDCNLPKRDEANPYALREGTCSYTKTPSVKRDIKGTDFSSLDQSSASTDDDGVTTSFSGLTYPKLQNEALRYGNIGSPNNPITYGSHFLALNQCDRATNQLMVVSRAKQTKVTVTQTGEWPLGWVDWGYTTGNGTILLDIYNSLPGSVSGYSKIILEGVDDYYLNSAGIDVMSDISVPKREFCKEYTAAVAGNKKWALDLSQAPIYSPSFRQGYVRGSICIWNICCPGHDLCPDNLGPSRALFYDISISQAFGGALDDLLLYYPLEEGAKIFKQAAINNQLIRFLTSAHTQAIPSVIEERLNKDLGGNECFDRRPNLFSWRTFGAFFDYLEQHEFLDPDKKCPGYQLQPELTKERGGAVPGGGSIISRIVNMIWKKVDDVIPTKKHLISVPDAMGQSISELQGHIYNTRDNLAELEKQLEYNQSLSNTVDDSADRLFAGKYLPVVDAKRRLTYFSCGSNEYANHETSIEDYALGLRPGCFDTPATSAGLCDPTAFEALIADSPWQAPLPEAVNTILNSEMFVGGKLNPELEEVYARAAQETGTPCEVLAGLHFEEGSAHFTDIGGPEKVSLTNGNPLEPGQSLLDTALQAGSTLQNPVPTNTGTLITSISNYNGGGNSNCQLGYPYPIPYSGCPKRYTGEDDPYATNMLDSRHTNMWLLFHSDNTPGEPTAYGADRPGAFAVALTVYNEATSKNTIRDSAQNVDSPGTGSTSGSNSSTKPEECGENGIKTALGCLSYGDNLASTLLTFLIGLSGVIALAVMLAGTVQIMTAAGDIEKSRKGRELFTAAIVGLFFIIFSVTLLRTFAGEIIKLPGF